MGGIRIYSLAKELGLDSKDLIELCARAGVPKNSALASLTEEERAQVEAAIKKAPQATATAVPAAAKPSSVGVLRREDYVPASGVSVRERVEPPPAPAAPPVSAVPTAEAPTAPPTKPAPSNEEDGEKRGPRRREPPRPRVAAPPPPAAPLRQPETKPEPPAQKPDLRLPPDAIWGGRKPLEEHIRKHEEKKRAAEAPPGKAKPAPKPVSRAVPVIEKDEDRPKPGAVMGREERQRRRGRRAARRRELDELTEGGGTAVEETKTAPRGLRRRGQRGVTAPRKREKITVELPITVRKFSEEAGLPARDIIAQLMKMGVMATINANLDADMVELVGAELGIQVELRRPTDAEEQLLSLLAQPDAPEQQASRGPVVTFLGHVDHGKTSLLDTIRKTNVVAGEAGGITQHIGAYQIERNGHRVTFVDTPGHEAFTAMRARGANVTDIAVLVVAADDGVMPQTEEAISHARAAGVPIVVAVNKCDLPTANPERVLRQLADRELLPTQWGGDTEVIETSAIKGQGIDELIETLTTLAELRELRANPSRPAMGTCLEASLSEGRGVVATLLVQNGTLRRGDVVLCGEAYGRIKAMYDDRDRSVEEAPPSTPVKVAGLDLVPEAGERFYVLPDLAQARTIAEQRRERKRRAVLVQRQPVTLDKLYERLSAGETKELLLVLKGDTRGSLEAIKQELAKLEHPEVQVRVLHEAVGGVNEGDVLLADAANATSHAIVIAFHVSTEERARALADEKGVEIRRYDIIYQVIDDIRSALEGMLTPEQREVETGKALVLRTFDVSRYGTIAGCRVTWGTIDRNAKIRLIRDQKVVNTFSIASLRREKDDVREVREGMECGIKLANFDDIKEGDVLEAFRIEEVKRTL